MKIPKNKQGIILFLMTYLPLVGIAVIGRVPITYPKKAPIVIHTIKRNANFGVSDTLNKSPLHDVNNTENSKHNKTFIQ